MAITVQVEGLQKYIREQQFVIQKAIIYRLGALLAELENHAKLNAGYNDITANLKSSIGGSIVKDGKAVVYTDFNKESGKKESTENGDKIGKNFLDVIVKETQPGIHIVMVAGMEYATYVENLRNKNVLKQTELKMNSEILRVLEKIKQIVESR